MLKSARGLYKFVDQRTGDEKVQVMDGTISFAMPELKYREMRIEPRIEELPSKPASDRTAFGKDRAKDGASST